jgi:hypothetical protein
MASTELGRSLSKQGEFHMEPRRSESARPKSTPERKKEEKGRFQIVKLEERIAPNQGGVPGHTKNRNCYGH